MSVRSSVCPSVCPVPARNSRMQSCRKFKFGTCFPLQYQQSVPSLSQEIKNEGYENNISFIARLLRNFKKIPGTPDCCHDDLSHADLISRPTEITVEKPINLSELQSVQCRWAGHIVTTIVKAILLFSVPVLCSEGLYH